MDYEDPAPPECCRGYGCPECRSAVSVTVELLDPPEEEGARAQALGHALEAIGSALRRGRRPDTVVTDDRGHAHARVAWAPTKRGLK